MARLLKTSIDSEIRWLQKTFFTDRGVGIPLHFVDKLVQYTLDNICYAGSELEWENPTPMEWLVNNGYSEAEAANLICDFQTGLVGILEDVSVDTSKDIGYRTEERQDGGINVYIKERRV